MCGVVGLYDQNGVDKTLVQKLLNESMIRGKHATGIAWVKENQIHYRVLPKSADVFDIPDMDTDMVIAHCRYSTSDLEYNQPIVEGDVAVVHNGVITQSDPSTWENTYNMQFKTKCDSEIALKHWDRLVHPLHIEGSMAMIVLDLKHEPAINFFRNEQRPLYYSVHDGCYIITSTADIQKRAGIHDAIQAECCVNYRLQANTLTKETIRAVNEDLQ